MNCDFIDPYILLLVDGTARGLTLSSITSPCSRSEPALLLSNASTTPSVDSFQITVVLKRLEVTKNLNTDASGFSIFSEIYSEIYSFDRRFCRAGCNCNNVAH